MPVYYPPSPRLTNWIPGVRTGIIGGIAQYRPGGAFQRTTLINVTSAPYNADNTGATNAAPAIQSAINAASSGQVVYLPAGDYLISSSLSVGTKKNITVRGAGMDLTRLLLTGNVTISVGSGSDYTWSWPPSNNIVTAGSAQNSTEISIGDTSAFSVGQIIKIKWENESDNAAIAAGAVPVVSVAGYNYIRNQMTRITAKTATTLSFFPPIIHAPRAALAARVNVAQFWCENSGLEDFTIDCTASVNGIPLSYAQCYNCWAYRVKSVNTKNYHIYVVDSLHCEVRQCWLDGRQGTGSNGAAILYAASCNGLVTDSIIARVFPCTEVNFGSCGNAFIYNVIERKETDGGGMMNTNHGPHNSHNLYEGNTTPNWQADGYFGGCSEDTFFRNWIHGSIYGYGFYSFTISANRFCRTHNFLGNIIGASGFKTGGYSFGNPNMGNSAFEGTALPTIGDFWADWKMTGTLTSRGGDFAGSVTLLSGSLYTGQLMFLLWGSNRMQTSVSMSGAVASFTNGSAAAGVVLPDVGTVFSIFPGPGGFQESDLDCEATAIKKGNYLALSAGGGSIPLDESLGGDTLPDSLAYASRPADWPTGFAWPPFDANDPAASQRFDRTPAGYWYTTGTWPSANVPVAPVFTRFPLTQAVAENATVILSADVSASPPPTWQWRRNGVDIPGATNRFLILSQVDEADEGSYTVLATNSEGSALSGAGTLTVGGVSAPVITTNPVAQVATEGADVVLSVNATGSPVPTWQWKKNGTNISGATGLTLTLNDVTDADEGSYTAVATNSQGSATSAAAVLTVNPAITDTDPPTPNPSTIASVTVNSASQITVVATTAVDAVSSPVQYNHSIGGVYQGWQSSATRVFTGLNPSTLYAFRVKARDALNNETTQSAESSATTTAGEFGSLPAPNPLGNRGTRARRFRLF